MHAAAGAAEMHAAIIAWQQLILFSLRTACGAMLVAACSLLSFCTYCTVCSVPTPARAYEPHACFVVLVAAWLTPRTLPTM